MSSVFTIVDEYQLLLAQIEDLEGEVTPELEAQLVIKEDEIANKVRAYHKVILIANSQIELAKEEQERLGTVRKTKENLIKRIKQYVNLAVETFGTIKPKAVGKSLDLGDLKVWQKKTEALDITGEIDDERFCNKQLRFEYSYPQAEDFLKYLEETTYADDVSINIIILKDQLKQWLLDNEEEHNKLIDEHNARLKLPNIEFEQSLSEHPVLSPEKEKDIKILLHTDLKHNSTVVFK